MGVAAAEVAEEDVGAVAADVAAEAVGDAEVGDWFHINVCAFTKKVV